MIFADIKAGDKVVRILSSPIMEIATIYKVTKSMFFLMNMVGVYQVVILRNTSKRLNIYVNESTLTDLYKSTIEAFPYTRFRQHSTNTIKIVELSIMPFKGMKTLLFRSLAQNEGSEYKPVMLFKKVIYHEDKGLKLTASDGNIYFLEPLSEDINDILVRCQCADFYWRFNLYDHVDKSLYGNKRKKYNGNYPANPKRMPGLCKHLLKMSIALKDSGLMKM